MSQNFILPSGPENHQSGPMKWLSIGLAVSTVAVVGCTSDRTPDVLVHQKFPDLSTAGLVSVSQKPDDLPGTQSPAPLADANNGPFRHGMKTAFPNCPVLSKNMAGLMNVHYLTLRDEGFSKHAALAFTLHMVKETTGGLSLSEQKEGGPGDGAGSVQFSHWQGDGTGRELSWFKNPDTGAAWAPADVMAREEGGRVSRRDAVINSAKAIAVLVRNMPNYQQLETASIEDPASFPELAMRSTKHFVRQSEQNDLRIGWIVETYQMNQKEIERNIGLSQPLDSAKVQKQAPTARRPLGP